MSSSYFSVYKRIRCHSCIVKWSTNEIFPWNLNLEYGGTFTKLFMHVSSRNMFPTTRNLQIPVHVYRPRHYCGKNWFTRHETHRFLNNHCQECVRAYLSIHDCLSFLYEVMILNTFCRLFLSYKGLSMNIKVILHQFRVKKIFPWNLNLEYGGTFTKLFMHVSSRNMCSSYFSV
jgi:hypothetical protein